MPPALTDEEIVQEVRRVVVESPGEGVFLHMIGSRARGDNRPNSDFDFVIDAGHPVPFDILLRIRALTGDLHTLHTIDITDLHHATEGFKRIAMHDSARVA